MSAVDKLSNTDVLWTVWHVIRRQPSTLTTIEAATMTLVDLTTRLKFVTERAVCQFCALSADRIAFANSLVVAIWDGFPVSPGHLLIVPRRHEASWDQLTEQEKVAVWSAVDQAIPLILRHH